MQIHYSQTDTTLWLYCNNVKCLLVCLVTISVIHCNGISITHYHYEIILDKYFGLKTPKAD